MWYRALVVPVLLAPLALLGADAGRTDGGGKEKDVVVKLFNGKDFAGWKMFVDPKKDVDPKTIWSVKDGAIHCEGSVNGYLLTDKEYENYLLRVQWRWGEKVYTKNKVRNSGVFVHVVGEDKIWPKAIEAQLMADHAGDFWLVGDFKLTVDPKRQDPKVARHYFRTKDGVEKKVGEWNEMEVACWGDRVEVYVNGHRVNEGSGAEVKRGRILLQSEGAEIWFRGVEMKRAK